MFCQKQFFFIFDTTFKSTQIQRYNDKDITVLFTHICLDWIQNSWKTSEIFLDQVQCKPHSLICHLHQAKPPGPNPGRTTALLLSSSSAEYSLYLEQRYYYDKHVKGRFSPRMKRVWILFITKNPQPHYLDTCTFTKNKVLRDTFYKTYHITYSICYIYIYYTPYSRHKSLPSKPRFQCKFQ